MILKENSPAPDFSLPDQNGNEQTLSKFLGQWVLIYFYPKDDTPGCTTEACTLRDNFPNFKKLNATVLGISKDSSKSHKKFMDKYDLPFTLLADEEKSVAKEYGVWVEKSMFGKKYMGMSRSSFLIDPNGIIQKVYPKVKPANHADEVISDIKELENNG